MEPVDIGSESGFPAGDLSNFEAREFIFDGVLCRSMEGLVQAFKTPDISEQIEICQLVGRDAKRRGRKLNANWQSVQKLWWQGQEFERTSPEYQKLLDRAFLALAQNDGFRRALLATGAATLVHTIGSSDPTLTVLTEAEFCSRLTALREWVQTPIL